MISTDKNFKDFTASAHSIQASRIAIFTLDSLYSNYSLKNLISILKSRVKVIVCTERISNKKYGSFFYQARQIISKSGWNFFLYLNLYVFAYRFLIYLGAFYRLLIGRKPKAYSLQWLSKRYGIKIIKVLDVNANEVLRLLKKEKINLVVSIHLDQLVREEVLLFPKQGCINLHYGELPQNAGPFPTIWNILRGRKESHVTVHFMNQKFDKGDILSQAKVELLNNESILGLDCRLHKVGSRLIKNVVYQIESGQIESRKQDLKDFRYRSYPDKSRLRLLKRRNISLFWWSDFFKYFF